MVFGNGVKNIQAAAYNGARTVPCLLKTLNFADQKWPRQKSNAPNVKVNFYI